MVCIQFFQIGHYMYFIMHITTLGAASSVHDCQLDWSIVRLFPFRVCFAHCNVVICMNTIPK